MNRQFTEGATVRRVDGTPLLPRPSEITITEANLAEKNVSRGPRRSTCAGLSLIELLAAMSILLILVAGASSGFGNTVARKQLVKAAQAVEQEMQLARRESAKRDTGLVVSFTAGTSWCLGVDVAPCDCNTASNCAVREVTAAAFGTGISLSAVNFSGASSVTMERIRRMPSAAGNADLQTASGLDLRVELLASGRTRLCSPSDNVMSYPSC